MPRLFAALAAALLAISTPALACQPFGAVEIEKLRAAGLPVELVEGEIAARVLAALRQRVEIDADPTRLVIVFGGEGAGIGLVYGEALCAIVSGPARETQEILRQARGRPS